MPHAELNGIRLYYEEEGDGPPLLLIAGLGGNRLRWATVLPTLREHHRCIIFDNRGTGRSDVPTEPYTIDDMGDDAAALIELLGVGPVDCVAVSLGSSVLQSLLINHPEQVKRAVLVSAFPSYTEIQHSWLDAALVMRTAGLDEVAQQVIGMPWVMTPRMLADHGRAIRGAQVATQGPEPTSLEGWSGQAAAIREYDSRARLGEVRAPCLVVVGAQDVLTPPQQAIEIASLIPDAKLVVLPRGGHGMLMEYPRDTLAEIRGFLE